MSARTISYVLTGVMLAAALLLVSVGLSRQRAASQSRVTPTPVQAAAAPASPARSASAQASTVQASSGQDTSARTPFAQTPSARTPSGQPRPTLSKTGAVRLLDLTAPDPASASGQSARPASTLRQPENIQTSQISAYALVGGQPTLVFLDGSRMTVTQDTLDRLPSNVRMRLTYNRSH